MLTNKRGFSLVEILVVMAIFGVVATVIFNLYANVQRSTISSEEVVEVQQGMRIALEQVAHDIQMAGVMVPIPPFITVADNALITMVTASAFNSFARISAPDVTNPATSFAAGSTAPVTINVGNGAMAQLFSIGSFVRIVQPVSGNQIGAFIVRGVNASSLRLEPLAAPAGNIDFGAGDMIVQVPSPTDDPTYPNEVTYQLEDDPDSTDPAMKVLSRTWRMGLTINERIIATNISNLSFEYLLDDGTVVAAVATAQLDKIVAVRIFLTGLTAEAKTGVSKTRELQTTVKIRNI